jgi:hypothetical protein
MFFEFKYWALENTKNKNYVMECFNFGLKFREWVNMLFKKEKTCLKTNGFNPFVFS